MRPTQIRDKKMNSFKQTKAIIISIFLLTGFSVTAQDIIILRSGDEIQAIIQEIGFETISYKRFDNQTGPNRIIAKSDVFMIRYANGSSDVFTDISAPAAVNAPASVVVQQPVIQHNKGEVYYSTFGRLRFSSDNSRVRNVEELLFDLPEVAMLYRSGKTFQAIGQGISSGGALLMLYDWVWRWDHITLTPYRPSGIFWLGVVAVAVGSPFTVIGNQRQRTAIDMYNAAVRRQQTADVTLNFGITPSGGLGLTLNF